MSRFINQIPMWCKMTRSQDETNLSILVRILAEHIYENKIFKVYSRWVGKFEIYSEYVFRS